MHRRLLPLILLAPLAGACSTSSPSSPPPPDGDGGSDAGASSCLACGGTTAPEDLDASLAARVRARFDLCGGTEGCHVSGAAGLSFPPGDELAHVVNVASTERPDLVRVKPGDPSASYLYLKVHGDGGIDGSRMPPIDAYDPKIPATIFAWIEAGAPAQ